MSTSKGEGGKPENKCCSRITWNMDVLRARYLRYQMNEFFVERQTVPSMVENSSTFIVYTKHAVKLEPDKL